MKMVIGGKRYDEDTAELLCEHAQGAGRSAKLYKTKKGNYFFVYLTQWQGERNYIEPCDPDEAKEFAARELDADEFEDAFGKVEEA